MNAKNDTNLPPRTGLRRLIVPWEYRHLRGVAQIRFAASTMLTFFGLICLAYGAYPWAALFLILATAHFAGAWWNLSIARSATSRS